MPNWFNLPAVAALTFVASAACGQVHQAVESVAHDATQKTADVADKVDDWVNAVPMQQRRDKCAAEGGQWIDEVVMGACENGFAEVSFDGIVERQACNRGEGGTAADQCLHRDAQGRGYFNDGPSVPHLLQRLSGTLHPDIDQYRYLDLFWPAGVNHDYCYHHGATLYGYDQEACDGQYFSDLSAVCANDAYRATYDWFKRRSCRQVAALHYAAVRAQGQGAYNVLQTEVAYPNWTPLWSQFGMAADVVDEELAQEIDEKLNWLGLLPDGD